MTSAIDTPFEGTVVVEPPPVPQVVIETPLLPHVLDITNPSVEIAVPYPGPPGRPGSSGAGFTHTQTLPQSVWVIDHNLNRAGPVGVVVTSLDYETTWDNVICQRVSANQVRLSFDDPTSGHALIL